MSEDWGEEPLSADAAPLPPLPGIDARVRGLLGPVVQSVVERSVKASVRRAVEDRLSHRLDEMVAAAVEESAGAEMDAQMELALSDLVASGVLEEPAEEPAPHYGSVDEFLREYLRFSYRRKIDGKNRYWAAEWWHYEEAINRLESLWRSWEHLRLDPATGMSVWHRDHLDHHMPILMSEDGPFGAAPDVPENKCARGEPLPYAAPPPAMFPDVRTTG